MAWANLYISLRNVAPTEADISKAWLECGGPFVYGGRYRPMPVTIR